MAQAKRVFEIARELGVDSEMIIAKRRREGVSGVEDEMATIRSGLEQTIRDWFHDADRDGNKQ